MAGLVALLAIGGRAFGGTQGMLLWGGLGLVANFVMYWFSDRLALAAHRAQPVSRAEAPTLYAIVERLTQRAGMPMPRIYLIPSASANAFATGRNPRTPPSRSPTASFRSSPNASSRGCWRTSCRTSRTATS